MKTAYFSFGAGHVHRSGGFTYDTDILVKITAVEPRAVMHQTFGNRWSFEYSQEPSPEDLERFWPRGIKELKL